jgi:hypothetical protein
MTLKQKIKFFITEVNKFMQIHSLLNYEVFFDESDNPDCRASCDMPDSNRQTTICYNKEWLLLENDLNEISKTAYHETLELLLSKLRLIATDRSIYYSAVQVDDEIHRIIRLLENIYFDKIKK